MCDVIYENFKAISIFCEGLDAECFDFGNCQNCRYRFFRKKEKNMKDYRVSFHADLIVSALDPDEAQDIIVQALSAISPTISIEEETYEEIDLEPFDFSKCENEECKYNLNNTCVSADRPNCDYMASNEGGYNMTIREIRAFLGLSRRQFANEFQIPIKTLENWEYGRAKPPTWYIYLFTRFLEKKSNPLYFDGFKELDPDVIELEPTKIEEDYAALDD